MNDRIRQGMKNNKGSSLAFVLIIGMVLMVMVASIMTVANSDFTFTQQSVESRQAYIDAKSVIEFGKIEIKERKEWLNNKNNDLKRLYQEKAASTSSAAADSKQNDIDALIILINNHMTASYYIGYDGEGNNIVKTLKSIDADKEAEALGVLKVTAKDNSATKLTNFTFKTNTKNLRRDLDYEIGLNYQAANIIETSGNIPKIPTDMSGSWLDTKIVPKTNGNKDEIQCIIQKSGNQKDTYDLISNTLTVHVSGDSLDVGRDKTNPNDHNIKFDWSQGKKLDLFANNICFSAPFPTDASSVYQSQFTIKATNELRFKEDYTQSSNAGLTNKLEADNIIFEKNLIVNNNDKLVINCKNLWINGDVLINAVSGTNSSITINAENIIVGDYTNNTGGNLKIGDKSNINWNCTGSIMILGNVDFLTNEANPVNSLTAKNISIGKETKHSLVTVKNATKIIWDCENFWLYGNMTTVTSGSYQEFKNIVYFLSGDINLSNNCQITVIGKQNSKNQIFVGGIIPLESIAYNVKIKNFELFQCNGDFGLKQNSLLELEAQNIVIKGNLTVNRTGTLNINTQYLDVNGKTYAENSLLNVTGDGTLKTRFNGYEQYNAAVNVTGAEKVIFGSPVILKYDGPSTLILGIKSDSIYLDNNSGNIEKETQFKYSGKTTGSGTDLYFYPNLLTFAIDWQTNRIMKPGKYSGVTGNKLEELPLEPVAYAPPPGWMPLAITLLNPIEPDGTGQSGGSGGTGGTVTGGSVDLDKSAEIYY